MWEEMWENGSKDPLFIYKIQYLMRWFGTSPATTSSFKKSDQCIRLNRVIKLACKSGSVAQRCAT